MEIDTVGSTLCSVFFILIALILQFVELGTYHTIKATLPYVRAAKGSYIHVSATLHYRGTCRPRRVQLLQHPNIHTLQALLTKYTSLLQKLR